MYEVVQLPDDKVQEGGLNVPELPSLHVTVPLGVFAGVEASMTVTVNVICVPEFTEAGLGVTVTVVSSKTP